MAKTRPVNCLFFKKQSITKPLSDTKVTFITATKPSRSYKPLDFL
ncbi:hypothetical protein [Mucilaginibacter sp.]